ncbi:inositol 2-dehydrogenase [Amaricoccus sp.]|uniref:inositol 2-dehydrogenase n=1 Tax=Amaricoccus sp. TaxID=1872485 RepID=UPI00261D1C77|nr:inositol 2-dehydrogenase [uncultured Amaricoccus sp.]
MTVRFALLGAGRIGKAHARAVSGNPDATLVAVTDALPDAAAALAAQYGAEVRGLDAIEASGDIDAVLICTPTDTHADLIQRFARAGKAIFCEKPVDLSLSRVQQTLKVVKETGATLMVGFNRRFDPDFRAVKDAIDAGRVGKVEMVSITSRDPGAPPVSYIARSGGLFRDMTIHDFDMGRWLLGEEVDRVIATGSVLTDPEIGKAGDIDSATVILLTASGRQCVISNSRRATYGYDQRIEVLGEKGAVYAENIHESTVQVATAEGFSRPPILNFFMERYADAYAAEIAAFVAAIGEGQEPPVTGEDGLLALALADAAVKSLAEGRVVKVSEIIG